MGKSYPKAKPNKYMVTKEKSDAEKERQSRNKEHILEGPVLWEECDRDYFNKFISDLSINIKTSVKTLLDDYMEEHKKRSFEKVDREQKTGAGAKKKKKQPPKKKDIIIEKQKAKKRQDLIKTDLIKIGNFNFDPQNIYNNISYLKTSEGIIHYKYSVFVGLLKRHKKINPEIIGLYYQLLDIPTLNKEFLEQKERITRKLEKSDADMYEYMLTNLGHIFPPLNFWDHNKKRLDPWQAKILRNANPRNNKSSIVLAPTASGKTFTAVGVCLLQKRVLYVVPTKPVAYQVASQFHKMNIKYNLLVDDVMNVDYSDTRIVIGTPSYVERYLPNIGIGFDYAVFDEIHNIMKEDDGHMYENIIKLMRCNFLALSASIGNIEYIRDKWCEYVPGKDIDLIIHKKRFINLQRHIWTGSKIETLHPLACIDREDLEGDFINKYDLAFTPFDTISLYNKIEEHFEDLYEESDSDEEEENIVHNVKKSMPTNKLNSVNNLFNVYNWKPYKFFDKYGYKDKLITLDMAKDYENFLKTNLQDLNKVYPERVSKMIEEFRGTAASDFKINREFNKRDLYNMFKELFKNKMGPAIVFNTDTHTCHQIFNDLYEDIQRCESEQYPYHYEILEFKQKLYLDYKKRQEDFNKKLTEEERYDKMTNFEKKELEKYTTIVSEYYQKLLQKISDNKDINEKIRDRQYNNLNSEFQRFLNYPDLGPKDIFKKHKNFCFTVQEPMSGDTIRSIRKEIKKATGMEIKYESVLFQMLKRGVGLYIEDVPDIYKWFVQRLVSEKKLYFVISDRTLCLGIDLPFRSSVLLGYGKSNAFTENDFTQMSGRAGRRGLDDKGNIVFCGNINPLKLMKGKHLDIVSNDKPVSELMPLLKTLTIKRKPAKTTFNDAHIKVLYNNFITKEKNLEESVINEYLTKNRALDLCRINKNDIAWKLRYYPGTKVIQFVENIEYLEKTIYKKSNNNADKYLYEYIYETFLENDETLKKILDLCFIENRINLEDYKDSNWSNSHVSDKLKELCCISMDIYNTFYKDPKYMGLSKSLFKIIKVIKHITYNNYLQINNM